MANGEAIKMIVIAAVPYIDTDQPIMAPAAIKGLLSRHGYKSTTLDLNIWLVNLLKNNPNKDAIINFFYTEDINESIIDDIDAIITDAAEQIAAHNPQIIALSLLIYGCQIFTRWLCAKLRQLCPTARIVIGGSGIKSFVAEYDNEYCPTIKNLGLIDAYIHGDADLALPEFVKGNLEFPGINNFEKVALKDINELPYADYSDYNFSLYNNPSVPIVDSRGCVKNCEFCDIIEFWEKFQWRSADTIFKEMLYQIEKCNNTKFEFRSSLVNGNLKEFKQLITLIAEYNTSNPNRQISWAGYFIIRSKNYHDVDMWTKLSKNNATLWLGVESLIPSVRQKMGKPYTNEDLSWHLEASKIYTVPVMLLIIVAYPYETLEDYEFTKQWFRDHKQYAGTVFLLGLSYASILPGTQLARNSSNNIRRHDRLPSVWINQNLNITTAQRLQYYQDLLRICRDECGFAVNDDQVQTLLHTGLHGTAY